VIRTAERSAQNANSTRAPKHIAPAFPMTFVSSIEENGWKGDVLAGNRIRRPQCRFGAGRAVMTPTHRSHGCSRAALLQRVTRELVQRDHVGQRADLRAGEWYDDASPTRATARTAVVRDRAAQNQFLVLREDASGGRERGQRPIVGVPSPQKAVRVSYLLLPPGTGGFRSRMSVRRACDATSIA
jgi:hypothetical protein